MGYTKPLSVVCAALAAVMGAGACSSDEVPPGPPDSFLQLTCADKLTQLERFAEAFRECADDAECVLVGHPRLSCDCGIDHFLAVNRAQQEEALQRYEDVHSCLPTACGDYADPQPLCYLGKCITVSNNDPGCSQ